jgi:putative molybdopterin biosynthesis protein
MAQPRRPVSSPRRLPSPAAGGLLTTVEAAAFLRVHPKQVYRLFARGLPHRRVGDEWRYDRDELATWSGATAARPGPVGPPPVVASNGDLVVVDLLALASRAAGTTYGSAVADRETALERLRARSVLAAGYHGTTFPARVAQGRTARLHLVRREVGLVAPRGKLPRIEDAARARLATRPESAGVRRVLDEAMRKAGLDPARANRRATVHPSHLEVVSAVARGEADLGVATRAWTDALGLSFRLLAEEDYGLLLLAEDLGAPAAVRLCETAQSPAFRAALARHRGYDASACGRIHLDPEDAKPRGGAPRGG